jgi:GNAT superfamily N-acetyltransferase
LLLAGDPGEAFGCIALRPLHGMDASKGAAGEVKRLYVQPAHRHEGWGRRLVEALIDAAKEAGYRELFLDTLERMSDARQLYARLGFRECAPYYHNPLPGAVYMRREL